MRPRDPEQRRCSYVVLLGAIGDRDEEILELAEYLSTLSRMHLDVVVADASRGDRFERNRSILRWVARHESVPLASTSLVDETVRAALSLAFAEKVIIASADVRYTPVGVVQTCELLDLHDAVEPHDFFDPLPWWSGVEMSRLLMHRAFDSRTRHGATLAVRRAALQTPRGARMQDGRRTAVPAVSVDQLDVLTTSSVLVRRRPPVFNEWLRSRATAAADDFRYPARTAIFLGAAPLLVLLVLLGGMRIAASYAAVVALASIASALRGALAGRGSVPLRASFFAPLWLAERTISVYCAAALRWRSVKSASPVEGIAEARRGKVASGE